MPEPVHIPTVTIGPQDGPVRYRWRKLLALIRRPNRVILTPEEFEFQTGDVAVAFFSGTTAPSGWTSVPNNPGMFYRTYQSGDIL